VKHLTTLISGLLFASFSFASNYCPTTLHFDAAQNKWMDQTNTWVDDGASTKNSNGTPTFDGALWNNTMQDSANGILTCQYHTQYGYIALQTKMALLPTPMPKGGSWVRVIWNMLATCTSHSVTDCPLQ
jgi:hypothetical protein